MIVILNNKRWIIASPSCNLELDSDFFICTNILIELSVQENLPKGSKTEKNEKPKL